ESQPEAALERFGDESDLALLVTAILHFEAVRLDEFLPVLEIDGHGLPLRFNFKGKGRRRLGRRGRCELRGAARLAADSFESDAAALGGPHAIVRYGRHIPDRSDGEADCLESSQRAFASGTRPLHFHFKCTNAMLSGLLAGVVGSYLGSIGSRLAAPLEAHHPGAGPADGVALRIGDGNHGIVEAGVHMRDAAANVFLVTPPYSAGFACHFSISSNSKKPGRFGNRPAYFFLPAIGFALPLRVRAFVCVRWPRTGRPLRWRRPR